MFWRAIKNSKLLRVPELVLPFCIRLGSEKNRQAERPWAKSQIQTLSNDTLEGDKSTEMTGEQAGERQP
jgi:hypothetical protein